MRRSARWQITQTQPVSQNAVIASERGTVADQPTQQGAKSRSKLVLDERVKGTLSRMVRDWVLPRRRAIALSLLVAVGLAAATSGYPAVIKMAFDTLGAGRYEFMGRILLAIMAITVLRGAFLFAHQLVSSALVMELTADLQQRTFRHLVNADYAQLVNDRTGQFVSRLTNDINYIQTAAQHALNSIMRDLITAIGLLGYMFYIDPVLSLIVLLVYPLAAIPILTIGRRLRKTAKRTQHELGDMTSLLTEKLAGARLIKTFRLENYAADRLDQSFRQVLALRLKAVRQRARLGPMLEALAGIAIAGVIWLASWRISNGISSVGDFMGYMTCLLLAANNVRSMSNLSNSLQEGIAGAERLYEVLDQKPSVVDRPSAKPLVITDGRIVFEDVAFSYQGLSAEPALRGISLVVPGGKTAALVGRSGSGKSTLLNLVPRLFDVTSGTITIDGQDVRNVTIASLRDQIAIVSQDITLFDDTIRANIELGKLGATDDEIVAAAKAAAAHDFIMAQPQGYHTVIGDGGGRLSGGQRQRLALARAILKDAPILLLDEATSALDTESERLVQEALMRFTRNRTTLVIAHRLSTVQRADVITVLDDGDVVEVGNHHELLGKDGAYARLCRSQLLIQAEAPSASIN
jgi:ATP-binding cassette, subfamily B, bacterial MsbA